MIMLKVEKVGILLVAVVAMTTLTVGKVITALRAGSVEIL
ncbi:hypothetical protein F469_01994 [Pseudomonas sp. URMO17WK12:I2]|nr:hypothetical protein F469_01994 [Pseudomonas sp. URMO17WK12:I2]